MKWIDVNDKLPVAGKYVVKTERPHPLFPKQKLISKIEVRVDIFKDKDSFEKYPAWHCSNQRVTHWLEE